MDKPKNKQEQKQAWFCGGIRKTKYDAGGSLDWESAQESSAQEPQNSLDSQSLPQSSQVHMKVEPTTQKQPHNPPCNASVMKEKKAATGLNIKPSAFNQRVAMTKADWA